jgi:shikimate kinase/3-dehydroquinate synthase
MIAHMQNIFLIGLSGSGKSTIARLLANQLGKPLFDIDALIEKECGESVPLLVKSKGEAYFRDCESRVLTETIQSVGETAGAIIDTGDGIVLRPENRQRMAEHGIRVYLTVEPEEALRRLQAQRTNGLAQGSASEMHPLLAGRDPLVTVRFLLAARSPWYKEADIICSTDGKSVEAIAHELIATLIGMGKLADQEPVTQYVSAGSGYEVVVEWGSLGRLPHYLNQLGLPPRIFLITDSNLQRLYATSLLHNLTNSGYEPLLYAVPAGEASKSLEQLSAIFDWLLEHRAERREAIVALGGGMIGDLVGLAAATYLRGVPLIQVPTSLLAQVDAAIGGKTAINHTRGKNLIGAFYYPQLVLVDPATLLTLPMRERAEGWAAVVKYGVILDADLFALLEAHAALLRDFQPPPVDLLCQIISRSIALRISVINKDEREQHLSAILNYGHTVAHAVESVTGYNRWLHGEALSLGMVVAAALAVEAGLLSVEEMERQNALLQVLGLPTSSDGMISGEGILAAMSLDKKVVGKRVHWILPQHIGQVTITPLPDELVRRTLATFFPERWISYNEEECL